VGIRALAYDSPGYGMSECPSDFSDRYRSEFILKFMNTLGIQKAYLGVYSVIARLAVPLVLDNPGRCAGFVGLSALPTLPPLPGETRERAPAEKSAPTLASTRERLEEDLYNHSLITGDLVQRRYRFSTGKNLDAAAERAEAARAAKGLGGGDSTPLWRRLAEAPVPKLYLFGKEDRGDTTIKRCALLRETHPDLEIHLIDRCRHLIMIDAEEEFNRRLIEFVARR
jgi:pimeloyl-ACP methyl ester carboxylesterase